MDGKNSRGRRVSLLNDEVPPSSESHDPLTRTSSSDRSRQNMSPRSPRLSRSDSTDSRYNPSQSPLTPVSANSFDIRKPYDDLLRHDQSVHHPRSMSFYNPNQHPMMDPYQTAQQALPSDFAFTQGHKHDFYSQGAAAPFEQQQAPYSPPTAAASKAPQKKNSYPCPVARQYSCQEFFTTSGHAARHAKKHTGKKDAVCPECNKAFTRKDNMEQHRRTHSSVRAAGKPGKELDADPRSNKKAKLQQSKKVHPSIATDQTSMQMEFNILDPQLGDNVELPMYSPDDASPVQYDHYQMASHSAQQHQGLMHQTFMHHNSAPDVLDPQLHQFAPTNPYLVDGNSPQLPSSLAPALDTLALAATSHQ